MTKSQIAIAIQEITIVKTDCQGLLNDIKSFSPPNDEGQYNDIFRLIATPMLYSVWERCFTLCHAIAIRTIRDTTVKTNMLSAEERALWLIKAPFYRSMIDQLRTNTPSSKTKKGEYSILSEFLSKFDKWLLGEPDKTINTDDLVMTFSNVNPEVVELNARSIGIHDFQKFKDLKLGRLNDLVGQRNDIGHGANIKAPQNEHFLTLLEFTENLVNDYCDIFIVWIQNKYPDK